jgi:hypothetical protein
LKTNHLATLAECAARLALGRLFARNALQATESRKGCVNFKKRISEFIEMDVAAVKTLS